MSEEDINEIKECIEICNWQEEYLKFDGKIRTINAPIPFESMDRMLQELQLKDKVIEFMANYIATEENEKIEDVIDYAYNQVKENKR